MTEPFNYDAAVHHVEKRSGLTDQLHSLLAELKQQSGARENWPQHERFAGEAEFWLQVHKALLGHIELLDGDHKVLTESLDQLETAFKSMPVIKNADNRREQLLLSVKAEELYFAAKRVNTVFTRHIEDEEEICIPALLTL